MKTFLERHRAHLVPVGAILSAAVLTAVFWGPLSAWFAGPEPRTRTAVPEKKAEMAKKATKAPFPGLPTEPLDEATFARTESAFASTDQVREKLAEGTLDGVTAQAEATAAALEVAAGGLEDKSAALRDHLETAALAARALAAAETIESAREHFGDVSGALIALADADPRLARNWNVFQCPMTEGHGKWFQRSETLENPYMGEEMLECGSAANWDIEAPPDAPHAHGDGDIAYYTCPMHPSVKADEAGACPICGMDLVPVNAKELETGTVIIDALRRQRIGVRTAVVAKRPLRREVRAVGAITYDESQLRDVSLRVSGWVQKLVADETGQRVKKGQTLFTIYSPELYAAELEYVALLRRDKSSPAFAELERAARSRLRLLGLSDGQIRSLAAGGAARESVAIAAPATGYIIEKNVVEGAHVGAGTQVLRIASLDEVWVDAELYEPDLPQVALGQKVTVTVPSAPGRAYEGVVETLYPALDDKTRTGRVRISLRNPDLALKPGMYASVTFPVDLGTVLALPESAVLYTGPRRLVFVDLGEGRLKPVEVELGVSADGYYEVTSGLSAGDVVVTSGNFLIAAESRLRSASKYWEAGDEAE